jgi:predicted DNA-binding protein
MGRPPLNVKATVVRLSVEMIARIEAVAGKHRMSQFLREAAEAELLRREGKKVQKPKPKS